ncbi:MAG TPA: RDD family protein [Methanospirillum sp.]|nr:RDD family protein [Methanospirillum sp.]
MADTIVSSNSKKGSGDNPGRVLSGFWRRVAAAAIDFIIISLIAGTAVAYLNLLEGWRMLVMMMRRSEVITSDGTVVTSILPMQVGSFLLVVFILIPWLYFAALESSKNQATLGKMAARILVTDLHGKRVTFARATLRHFSKFLSFFLFLAGFLCIRYTRYHQGLHDVIAACLIWYQKEIIE